MQLEHDSWSFVDGFGGLSREMLAAMLDQNSDCVKILDPAGRLDFMNRNGRCTMEIDDFAAIAGQPWEQLWPEESQDAVRAAVAAARAGSASRFEAFCPTAKGAPKWWDISVTPVRDPSGELFAILSLSRDVTEQHQALEANAAMAHEMRHRLRNAYAVSGAIALASGREDGEHEGFAIELAQRLQSLSLVQAGLIDPAAGGGLRTVARRVIGAFDARGLVATADLPDAPLGEQAVRLLALVLGELATNSLKHGALREGRPVAVSASCEDERLTLVWREEFAPGAKPPAASGEGSGHRLMRRMARAHGGRFVVELREDGLEARLETPADR
ncbi:MAG: PAS domain-containing protein [Novosphingobium sp.]|nr:PAS domain-containing protein [Novosphingobium sp.]